MRAVLLTALVLLAPAPARSEQSGVAEREPRFLSFAVKDRHRIYVRDLRMEEVELKVDGKTTDVRYFGYRNVATAFAVVIENSPRTARFTMSRPEFGQINLVDQVRANLLEDFFDPITTIGPCMLAQFDRELEVLQDFTAEPDILIGAVNQMTPQPKGLTVQHVQVGRVIARTADMLRQRDEKRKILVLFTTIIDRESYKNFDEYRDMLRLFDVELFVISFAPRSAGSLGSSFEEKNNAYFFRRLANETAGRAMMTGEFTYLDELFTDLKGWITNFYTVGFYVDVGSPPEEHKIELAVDREKARISHRKTLVF